MYSVTQRISVIKQPSGGYIAGKSLDVIQLDDGIKLNEKENIHASLTGLAVDYMTRFMMGAKKEDAFSISLKGSNILENMSKREQTIGSKFIKWLCKIFKIKSNEQALSPIEKTINLIEDIKGLDEKSIINACKLVGFDVCFRNSTIHYKPIEEINPDDDTIKNIETMVKRSITFFEKYGPIVKDGFTFEGGYTDIISAGDGDFLTKDTLWDFKVSKNGPTIKHTLQLLIYYLMGIHSIHEEFQNIKNLGIFNPRLNKIYTININLIPQWVIDEVSQEVIGY